MLSKHPRTSRAAAWRARALVGTLALLTLAACNRNGQPAAAAAPGGGMPPPEVGVVTVSTRSIALTTELPGRLEASRSAQVRARVAGIVQKRLFREGSDVQAGQPLYRIDAAPYEATLRSAQAQLARAEANLAQVKAQAERYEPLVKANAISQQEYVNAVAAQKQAQAEVAVAQASIRTAQINLGYASVEASISGRIGRSLVTEGALVGQGEATPLAVIQQIDPIFVNFTQSTSELFELRRAFDSGRLERLPSGEARVHVRLDDGGEYPQPGRLLFTDLTVDPSSGQVTLRAEVPNPKRLLLPGMYVRVRLEQAQLQDAIVLPQQAVMRNERGDTVMVVGPDGRVAPRPVKVGSAEGNQWVVLDGLKPGEQVMVDGFQKLQGPGPVKPVPWQPGASALAGNGSGVGAPEAAARAPGNAAAASAPAAAPPRAPAASGSGSAR